MGKIKLYTYTYLRKIISLLCNDKNCNTQKCQCKKEEVFCSSNSKCKINCICINRDTEENKTEAGDFDKFIFFHILF